MANWKIGLSKILVVSCMALLAEAADIGKPVPVTSAEMPEYRLGPEDLIDVFVWKEPELAASVVIRPDGRISLPLTGELEASGKTAAELQNEITEKLRQFIANPVVSVMVKQINSLKISVLGEVRKPDVYKIKNRITVLDAIAMAGGFTDFAKQNNVIVLRTTPSGSKKIRIKVKQAIADDGTAPFYLQSLDTVYVE